jgi:large subunit ribosomal protein L10
MSLTRKQKEEVIALTEADLKAAVSIVLISYDKLTVAEGTEMRNLLSEAGGHMRVMPKRLLKIAFSNIKIGLDPTDLEGQVAVAWADDPVAPAKVLNDFAKKHEEKIQLLAGSLEGNVLTMEEVKALATLPTREQLLGQLLSVFNGPVQGTVRVLSGVQTSAVRVLQAIADQKESN